MKFPLFPTFRLSILHHLVGLVLIAIIPLMVFASGLMFYLAQQRSKTLENNILSTTKVFVTAVDENLISVVTSLKILSESEGFEADTVQYLHKRLRQFVKNEKEWDHISFVDTRGIQIFNTSVPYGRKLPRLYHEDFFRLMMKTGDPVVSGYRQQDKAIIVSVPVKREGIILYALVGSIKLSSFAKLLKSQSLPLNWTAAILDGRMNYIAHSRSSELFTGKKASQVFIDQANAKAADAYSFSYKSEDGAETFGAIASSKVTNWKIILRIPDDGHLFTSWKTIFYIMIGGSLLVCLSLIIAFLVARKITKPLMALTQSAKDLGKGNPISEIRTSLSEVIDVNEALIAAQLKRKVNEEKIQELYSQAQEAVKIRDTFMSVASHELKTPITTIKLQFQLLSRLMKRKGTITTEELEKPIHRVDNVVNRLNDLIDDLLDVSRISAGKLTYHPEPVVLGSFTHDVIQSLEEEAMKKGSAIFFRQEGVVAGLWDKHRLEQVLVNLITNAIKYGNAHPIFVTVKSENGNAVIEVKDHGMGISEVNLPKIFDRFERVGNHNGITGLGLGLWIVKKILEGFKGSITVESKTGEGSTFRIYLPMLVQNNGFISHHENSVVESVR